MPSWFLINKVRRAVVNRSAETLFPQAEYERLEKGVITNETLVLLLPTDHQGKPLPQKANTLGALCWGIPGKAEFAARLEAKLGLPDSDNLLSKRIGRIVVARAEINNGKDSDIRRLCNPDNAYYKFFTESERASVTRLYGDPKNFDHSTVLSICADVLTRRKIPSPPAPTTT